MPPRPEQAQPNGALQHADEDRSNSSNSSVESKHDEIVSLLGDEDGRPRSV